MTAGSAVNGSAFEIKGRKCTLYRSREPGRPLIVLNHFDGDGGEIVATLRKMDAPDHSLLTVGDLDWNHDMTPWPCPPIRKNDTPFTGGADGYLEILLQEILPATRKILSSKPAFTGIAGYSLAGLFALYSMYKCDEFDRAASMSGSLWFPDFIIFIMEHDFKKKPYRIYLSLGDKEAKTRNPFLGSIQASTETAAEHYRSLGLNVCVEMNPGNHFRDAGRRTAKGILALLDQ